jgi:hypothetical protein
VEGGCKDNKGLRLGGGFEIETGTGTGGFQVVSRSRALCPSPAAGLSCGSGVPGAAEHVRPASEAWRRIC